MLKVRSANPGVLATIALIAIIGSVSSADGQQTSQAVTLQHAASADNPGEWLLYGGDYSAHRYSTLDAINRSNVKNLRVAWARSLGKPDSLEGTPIVKGDTMYVTTGRDTVFAFDAKTGKERWHYAYPFDFATTAHACCNNDNRGVTLYKNEVITATLDAHLIGLDAATGKLLWNITVAPNADGYTITSPPLLVKNMLITGVAGGEFGIRGFVAAYDADSHKQVWRHFTTPSSPGDPGYDTWGKPESLEHPGAPTWVQGTYDAELNSVYWGVGNPEPNYDPHEATGKRLYTDSLLALDPDTGNVRWYYQYTPGDIWDYDGVNTAVIVDVPIDGKTVKAVAQANRNGIAYLLDRTDGKVIWAEPFVDKINFAKVDRDTGNLTINPQILASANAYEPYTVCPAHMGGTNWSPTAYDPTKHLFFIPVIEGCDVIAPAHQTFVRGDGQFNGGKTEYTQNIVHGSVVALDLTTGKIAWKKRLRSPQVGGVLVTAGGLVFDGSPSGQLRALDENSGNVLWHYKTDSALNAPPITYSIDGVQYIAILSGTGGTWRNHVAASPWLKNVPNGAKLYVFALGRQTARR